MSFKVSSSVEFEVHSKAIDTNPAAMANDAEVPVDVSPEDLDIFFAEAFKLTMKGGELVKAAISGEKQVEEKASKVDLVTETDKAVEKLLFDGLR